MFRRLLTCLALLTGLAATGAPVHAEILEAVGERIEAGATHLPGSGDAAIEATARLKPGCVRAAASVSQPSAIVEVSAPCVRIRIDRAYE